MHLYNVLVHEALQPRYGSETVQPHRVPSCADDSNKPQALFLAVGGRKLSFWGEMQDQCYIVQSPIGIASNAATKGRPHKRQD